ncbi:MAG: hypothetical protein FJ125_04335 [Deltaproteobacteria bacterium]|nr:hypothetical protein [Deltaproteobacteria bacterium]
MPGPSAHEGRVFVQATGRRIQPFDDPLGETPIQNRPLAEWQARAFAEAGLTRIDEPSPPCLVVPDTLFANGEALRAFVQGAAGRDAVLVLGRSLFGEATTPVQPQVTRVAEGWRFEAIRFVSGRQEQPVSVLVDPREWVAEFPAPQQYAGTTKLSLGVPRRMVMTLHHWVHVLWANQTAGGVELRSIPRWRLLGGLLWAMLRAMSFNRWKVLGKLNRIGRRCNIHPTALVEGSTLGDGVFVGPFARVAFSTIGDGAVVMPSASVELCVVGAQAIVADYCVVRSCVLYPGAAASQLLMQQCVLGRDAVTTKGGVTLDLNFDQEIKVPLDGRMHGTGLRFLGSAFGHRCRIGTGFYLSPGKAVPNDYFLIRDPRAICSVLPPGLAGGEPLVASGRRLRPQALLGLGRRAMNRGENR